MNSPAHQCGELTALVRHHAHQVGIVSHQLGIKGNFHWLALTGNVPPDQTLSDDMREWPDDIFFIDVWCGIHGRANEYAEKFLAKMANWRLEAKQVFVEDAEEPAGEEVVSTEGSDTDRDYENGQYVDADSEAWTQPILEGEKEVDSGWEFPDGCAPPLSGTARH